MGKESSQPAMSENQETITGGIQQGGGFSAPEIYSSEYLLSKLPFSEIPLREGRNDRISPFKKHVALHEGGHVLAALDMGYYVEEFSVVPGENYSGIAIIQIPTGDIKGRQIIAAAGSWHSHRGNGSDMVDVYRGTSAGGISAEDALASAKTICSRLSPHEWDIFSELVVIMGTIKGHQIPDLLERVKLEARLEQSAGISIDLLPEDTEYITEMRHHIGGLRKYVNEHPDAVITIQEETIYEETEDGRIKKYKKVNGKADLNTLEEYCARCGRAEGHEKTCSAKNEKKETKANPISLFPKRDVIFPLPISSKIAA